MADKPLFILDAEGRWRLAYDRQQLVLQRRAGTPCRRGSDSAAMRRTGWRAVSFVGSTKRVLTRVLGEKDVVLTPEAQARLDALPERFMDFITTLETVADLGQRESPEPENGRTVRSHLPDGSEHQPEPEYPSMAVVGAQASEAA